MIVPGSTTTLEMVYSGSGNRNQTVGDSISTATFIPTSQREMWSLWRVHDVLKQAPSWTRRRSCSRSHHLEPRIPDGEIETARDSCARSVRRWAWPRFRSRAAVDKGTRVIVEADSGRLELRQLSQSRLSFLCSGVGGHRRRILHWILPGKKALRACRSSAQPAARLIWMALPRHLIIGGEVVREFHTRWASQRQHRPRQSPQLCCGRAHCYVLPEMVPRWSGPPWLPTRGAQNSAGTDGKPGNFISNGLPPHTAPLCPSGCRRNGHS